MSKKGFMARGSNMLANAVTGAAQANVHDPRFKVSQDHPQVIEIDVDQVDPNPDQPRQFFDDAKLKGLADSISEFGLRQPIGVTEGSPGRYVLVWGERRLRASKIAGLETIFAILVKDKDSPELALIENLQREDLDPFEIANGLMRLSEQHKYGLEKIASSTQLSRSEAARLLSLLQLPHTIIQEYPHYRQQAGKSMLFELVDETNNDTRLELWNLIKEGVTVKGLREARKRIGSRGEIPPDSGLSDKLPAGPITPDQSRRPHPVPVKIIRASVAKLMKSFDELGEDLASIDDQQREDLRALRERINGILRD
ncbi:ParB/RepB/Spo0J family partition protein [Azospirillum sp. SYSU D00513]|uniref:ParB/RepB/Spo0J family partition protein n=1 Tax=Azospirillum sp. SYSU D00513 TaxID=2812561 RepID=UPI001A9770EE|nr:ParB/RepB/Spo0J family partition protein [Azospirillum sp. SYSU D00513]